jgi:anti-sigma factor RsiW
MSACPPYPILVALWAGELEESEATAIDEHLFGCDACAAATERLAKIVGTLRVEAGKRRAVGEYVVKHVWR